MLRSLDLLGALKWPSLLAITALPVYFYFNGWRDLYTGADVALYGPELVAGMPLLLSHDADAELYRDAMTE